MDTLLKEAERRGYKVEVTPFVPASTRRYGDVLPSNESRIIVDDVPISFRLRERSSAGTAPSEAKDSLRAILHGSEWAENYRPRSEFVANGKFELTMAAGYPDVVWSDTATRRLEDRLNEVFAKLPLIAHAKHERDAAEERRQAAERVEAERRWAERKRAEAEKQRVEAFKVTIEQWRFARDIRAYVDEVAKSVDVTADLQTDLAWARGYANRVDPVLALRRQTRGDAEDAPPVDEAEE